MKYYWVTVDFELNGNDYSDRFLFKHKTEISEENALERYILECVDFDAICEDGVWITDKGNTRDYSCTEVPLEDALIMEKYTNSLTFDGVQDEV
jgi:hypothetical protein